MPNKCSFHRYLLEGSETSRVVMAAMAASVATFTSGAPRVGRGARSEGRSGMRGAGGGARRWQSSRAAQVDQPAQEAR